jgi:hypothetical protein
MNYDSAITKVAETCLADSDLTNPDRVTFERHVACLSDLLRQTCEEYCASCEPPETDPREKGDDDGREYGHPQKGWPNALHSHHMIHKSQGGQDCLDNLIALCKTDHDLHHDERLHIAGAPEGTLFFTLKDLKGSVKRAWEHTIHAELPAPRTPETQET